MFVAAHPGHGSQCGIPHSGHGEQRWGRRARIFELVPCFVLALPMLVDLRDEAVPGTVEG